MSQFDFDGDINNISERQLRFISDILLKHGFENSKVHFEPVGKTGDNFAAHVKRITITGDNGSLQMIAKIAPTLEVFRQPVNTFSTFKNEHIMYTEFLPKLVQLQKDAGFPAEEQLRYAKCYGSLPEQPNEVILLEDLKVSNFIMLDRFLPLSNECVKSVLKNFALLHSLSYVLRYKEPETFNDIKTRLVDIWTLNAGMEYLQEYCKTLENDTLLVLEDEKYTNIVRHRIANTLREWIEVVKVDVDNKYTVIQQGDSWTSNIMFRFEDDQLPASVMIDYQASKNGSPVCDILFLILNCTDYDTRKQYFNDWLDFYYIELEKSLSNYSFNAKEVYPRQRLNKDLKHFGPFMFGHSMILSSLIFRKSDDAAKILDTLRSEDCTEAAKDLAVSLLDEESKTHYRNRLIGLIESSIEFGLL